MILPSPRARRWSLIALGLTTLLLASYVVIPAAWRAEAGSTSRAAAEFPAFGLADSGVQGGSPLGLLYGLLGVALILTLLAFGIRKRRYRSTFGTLDGWLQAHIWLGLLCVVTVLLHSGFRFEDRIASASFLVLSAVVLSGLLGARLYASLPRRLSQVEGRQSAEATVDQLQQLHRSMARLARDRSPAFVKIYRQLIRQTRPPALAGWRLVFFGAGRHESVPTARWQPLLIELEEGEREPLRKLLALWRQHRELHQRLRYQQRYKNLLQAWLYLHLPLSIVLVVLVMVHVLAALYFRGLEVL